MSEESDKRAALTERQALFWLDEQLFPSVPYHLHVLTVRLAGALDEARFRDAFAETVSDIDQFRLTLEVVDGVPMQRIQTNLEVPLETLDLRHTPERLESTVADRAREGFLPGEGFHRALLIRLEDEVHVFCLFLHHIASDGASVALIVKHLAGRYAGDPVAYHPPVLKFVESEHAQRGSKKAARDATYWNAKLAGGVPPMRFYGQARTSTTTAVARTWVDATSARRQRLAEPAANDPVHLLNDSVSRLVALATVVFALVHRVTGNRKLAIGTPVPNRSAQFLDTCGLLMQQVFLIVDIDEAETFATLATKVRTDVFHAFRHAQHCVSDRGLDYVTLNLLTDTFGSFGDLDAQVRLQAACTLEAGGDVTPAAEGDLRDTFGIQVHDFESGDGFRIGFDLHAATFEESLRARVPAHFFALFDAFCDDLNQRIDHVALVGTEEREELVALGRGDYAQPPRQDVLAPIERAFVEHAPRAALIGDGDGIGDTLTYAELAQHVSALARELQAKGVVRGSRVGLFLTRGVDEPIAMLAALKIGAAYVPLDPSHPAERVAMIIEDATPEVLLTHSALMGSIVVPSDTVVLALDTLWPTLLQNPGSPSDVVHDAADLAYILFTSGSTGRPKGVEVPRGALANFLGSMAHTPGFSSTDQIVAVTTTTFDISGLELLLPLTVGGSVRIASRETAIDPDHLARTLAHPDVTTLQATPATFRMLVDAGWEGSAALRVLVGGEALSPELAGALLTRVGEVWNMYGPTETTVWSTVERVTDAGCIRIGRPIDRTHVFVVDAAHNLVPRGVIGELVIGGDGVARGYHGRPDLTAARFLESPPCAPGERVYLTGDLARFDEQGRLTCFGRVDQQVKIRGFRIELGEIESVLRGVPEVLEVVVLARRDTDAEDPRLVAYYAESATVAVDRLREAATSRLPSYMRPVAYVRVDAFPLNTNGKIDRAALPAPEPTTTTTTTGNAGRRATNDREVRMVALFRDVLGVLDANLDDDFFALGGSSPLALDLRRRITLTFGAELPLRMFFDNPCPQSLLDALDQTADPSAARDGDDALVVVLRRGPDTRAPLFCVLGVQLYDDLARALIVPRTVYGLHVPTRFSPLHEAPPTTSVIAARYVQRILALQPTGPFVLFGLCYGGLVAFEAATQLRAMGHEVALVGVVDAVLPRAVHVDRLRRARAMARLAFTEPHRIRSFITRRAERWVEKLPPSAIRAAASRRLGSAPALAVDERIDLPLAGPLVEAQFAEFERTSRKLDSAVIVFRAADAEQVEGHTIDEDGGFATLARKLEVYTLPGDHLGLLKAPHVRALAAALEGALATALAEKTTG